MSHTEEQFQRLVNAKAPGFWRQFCALMRLPIYVSVVAALASLYFVVAGVQYWSTAYLHSCLGGSVYEVNAIFLFVTATAPVSGVFAGGALIDWQGGYKGRKKTYHALLICVGLGTIAGIAGTLAAFSNSFIFTAIMLWILSFFGGTVLPVCTGIFISAVPRSMRTFASSFSVLAINLFGFSMSTMFTGYIMAWARANGYDNITAMRWGYRVVLLWSWWAVVFLGFAAAIARMKYRRAKKRRKGRGTPLARLPGLPGGGVSW
jgi:MFS family permease